MGQSDILGQARTGWDTEWETIVRDTRAARQPQDELLLLAGEHPDGQLSRPGCR